MRKSFEIHKSHHAVQLVQREGFICVICHKCNCCTPDRMDKECRPPNATAAALFGASHISGVRVSTPPERPQIVGLDSLHGGLRP